MSTEYNIYSIYNVSCILHCWGIFLCVDLYAEWLAALVAEISLTGKREWSDKTDLLPFCSTVMLKYSVVSVSDVVQLYTCRCFVDIIT